MRRLAMAAVALVALAACSDSSNSTDAYCKALRDRAPRMIQLNSSTPPPGAAAELLGLMDQLAKVATPAVKDDLDTTRALIKVAVDHPGDQDAIVKAASSKTASEAATRFSSYNQRTCQVDLGVDPDAGNVPTTSTPDDADPSTP